MSRHLFALSAGMLVALVVSAAPAAAQNQGQNDCKADENGKLICARGSGEQGGGGGGFNGFIDANGEQLNIDVGGTSDSGGETCVGFEGEECVGTP